MNHPLIEGKLKRTLRRLVIDAAPNEVGGLIIDGERVHILQNRAANPSDTFEFQLEDLKLALEIQGVPVTEIIDRVTLWHSHPAGGVGPSRTDMRQKTPLAMHLVVALVEEDIVPTWY